MFLATSKLNAELVGPLKDGRRGRYRSAGGMESGSCGIDTDDPSGELANGVAFPPFRNAFKFAKSVST